VASHIRRFSAFARVPHGEGITIGRPCLLRSETAEGVTERPNFRSNL